MRRGPIRVSQRFCFYGRNSPALHSADNNLFLRNPYNEAMDYLKRQPIRVIRSGGQTGVDRGALDAAKASGIPIEGWCPKGGWAEDRPEPPGLLADYPELHEAPSDAPDQRTEWNVRDSDATLILYDGRLEDSPGTTWTYTCARRLDKPVFCTEGDDISAIRAWLASLGNAITLNVAGPRESRKPGIYDKAYRLILTLLGGEKSATKKR